MPAIFTLSAAASPAEPPVSAPLSSAEKRGDKPKGQPQSDEPDVLLDVPNVHVGKLEVEVERLEAHVASAHR